MQQEILCSATSTTTQKSLEDSDILQSFVPRRWPEKLRRNSGGAHGRTFPNVSKGVLEFSACLKAALEIHSRSRVLLPWRRIELVAVNGPGMALCVQRRAVEYAASMVLVDMVMALVL
ncbi:unnamed protein product [Pleuronectes platessa]|uniref:Uncharacterized protein n=1 Tax=Pleuronectes platessa TaxID=8262 RepID=A0A9N7VNH4_PLEPL|nr:unnamed protein product [Pleuronectes platessa]